MPRRKASQKSAARDRNAIDAGGLANSAPEVAVAGSKTVAVEDKEISTAGVQGVAVHEEGICTPDVVAAHRRPTPARVWLHVVPLVVLLPVAFLQLYLGVRHKSSTLDEQNHITRGLAYLRTDDLRLNLIHPPLINVICALPLAWDKRINLPLDDLSWRTADYNVFATQLLWAKNDNGPSIVARARIPVMIVTLLLGVFVYLWAYELFGWKAATLALALLCFDPNILAHGALATNDAGMACFSLLSAYTVWRMLRKPTWTRSVLAGVALGLALTAKFSSIFLLAALPLMAVAHLSLSKPEERTWTNLKRLAVLSSAMVPAALFTLWAVYGFQIHYSPLSGFPFPARAYLDGLELDRATIMGGRPTFLFGNYSQDGWWYYFPIAFLVKTPLPTLVLLGAAVPYAIRQRNWRQSAVLLVPAIVYFALAMHSPLQIGYRHLLPVLPFLFIFMGQLANIEWSRFKWVAFAAGLSVAWLIAGTIRIYPDYLTYFNEAAGGPSGGARILSDSNIDWGQDLPGLADYIQTQKLDSIRLCYFGSARPEAYGITNYDPLPSFPYNFPGADSKVAQLSHPPKGVYAISQTNLKGVFFKNHDLYRWFWSRKPDAVVGHSIYIYRIP
ncbi:MAG TPA: glycosyltransferase family 39 protein [Blastocatellia bacterium]